MKNQKTVLLVNSDIPWGGMGQYSIGLANELSNLKEFKIIGLITHSKSGRFESFVSNTTSTKYYGDRPRLIKYILIFFYIWHLRPDAILINHNATVHFLLKILPRSKVIAIIHSDDPNFYRVSSINSSCVNAWVAPSPKTMFGLLKFLGVKALPNKIHMIPHGVEDSCTPRMEHNRNKFKIVFAGALFNHKGVDLLPEIFYRFSQRHPDGLLTIAGEGPLCDDLIQEFSRLKLTDRVHITGLLPREDVRKLFADSDVLLFPTRLEGFGLVIAESMAEGCVPIVTHLEGITDNIISSKDTGFLVEINNIDGFVNCLSFLYQDREYLLKMSCRASEVAREKFSISRMAMDYAKIINDKI